MSEEWQEEFRQKYVQKLCKCVKSSKSYILSLFTAS